MGQIVTSLPQIKYTSCSTSESGLGAAALCWGTPEFLLFHVLGDGGVSLASRYGGVCTLIVDSGDTLTACRLEVDALSVQLSVSS